MEHSTMLCILLGAITTAASLNLPMDQWDDDDVAIMAQFSTDYYNKVSRDSAIYRILANDIEYLTDEKSQSHQLQFAVKETLCQKTDNDNMAEGCNFKEDGVVKLCTANFFVKDSQDIVVVNCSNQHQEESEHTRVRRSRSGRGGGGRGSRGGGGRGGGGRGKSGGGSSIAGGGGRGGNTRTA